MNDDDERKRRGDWSMLGLGLSRADEPRKEVEYVHGGEDGWVRIGRYDSARRRSLWCRVVESDDPLAPPLSIELCSGREGDDAYVKLTAADPQWKDLCDVLLRVEGDCGVHPKGER